MKNPFGSALGFMVCGYEVSIFGGVARVYKINPDWSKEFKQEFNLPIGDELLRNPATPSLLSGILHNWEQLGGDGEFFDRLTGRR